VGEQHQAHTFFDKKKSIAHICGVLEYCYLIYTLFGLIYKQT